MQLIYSIRIVRSFVIVYRLVQKKGTVLLSTSLAWLAAAGQKLSLNLAPFLLLNPVVRSPPRND